MSATSVIYRRELGAYAKSPWSWAIMAAALLLAGIAFLAMGPLAGDQLSRDRARAVLLVDELVHVWSPPACCRSG